METPVLEPIFNKFSGLKDWKEIPTKVFYCEYYEIFKRTYIEEHLQTVASASL